jgi:L-ascorbate metabolism protein UlaG (beta-lactamase superfamily)
MRFTFLGHAAFMIKTNGQTIITDPYNSSIGYAPIREVADVVTLSHDNPKWHSCLDDIEGDYQVVNGLDILDEGKTIGAIPFGAALVYERLPDEGPNSMVWFESEGIRVLHMGDCGVLPSEEALKQCGRVDVLLALTGGTPTIELPDLMQFIEKLQPKIVVPMHFGVPGLQMSALPVGAFEEMWSGTEVGSVTGSLEITAATLPEKCELRVLAPTRMV